MRSLLFTFVNETHELAIFINIWAYFRTCSKQFRKGGLWSKGGLIIHWKLNKRERLYNDDNVLFLCT